MWRVTSGNCVGILSLFSVLRTLRSLTWGCEIIHPKPPGVSGICAEVCRDSSSYVSRDVVTSPSWAQHCSTKTDVSFSALTGLWHVGNAVRVCLLWFFFNFPVVQLQNVRICSWFLAWWWWHGERNCCPYMLLCFLSLSAAWIRSPPQSPN